MAAPDARPSLPAGLDAGGIILGVISARWNVDIVDRLVAGARRAADAVGADVRQLTVPGAFELPFAARTLAPAVDAIVVVGAVVRGETTH